MHGASHRLIYAVICLAYLASMLGLPKDVAYGLLAVAYAMLALEEQH